jgi:hypothetical protein
MFTGLNTAHGHSENNGIAIHQAVSRKNIKPFVKRGLEAVIVPFYDLF